MRTTDIDIDGERVVEDVLAVLPGGRLIRRQVGEWSPTLWITVPVGDGRIVEVRRDGLISFGLARPDASGLEMTGQGFWPVCGAIRRAWALASAQWDGIVPSWTGSDARRDRVWAKLAGRIGGKT